MKSSQPLLIKWLTRYLLIVILCHMGPLLAQNNDASSRAAKLLEQRRQVIRFEDVGQMQLDDSPEIPIRVVYYNGKSDVAVDYQTLQNALQPLITPIAFQAFQQNASTQWITFKTLKEWGYRCQFSKLTLLVSIEIPVAYRIKQEISLQPRVKTKPVKITHLPATFSGYVNLGGTHEMTPDTISTAFDNGYTVNGMFNLSQNIIKWGLIKPIPKDVTTGGFDAAPQVSQKSSRDWVLTNVQFRHQDYNNQWIYLLGDLPTNPNQLMPIPSMWGVGVQSMPRSQLSGSGKATTTFDLELSENSEVIFAINDKPIYRIKRKAGRHRFIDIPLSSYFNELIISVVPESNTTNITRYTKTIYHDPGALPAGSMQAQFQLGSPLTISSVGRAIDAGQLMGMSQVLWGIGDSSMLGGNFQIQYEQFRVGIDYIGVTPLGGIEIHPQFEQVATKSMAHILFMWNLFDPNQSLQSKTIGFNWLSKVENIPLSQVDAADASMMSMSHGLQMDWQILSNVKLQSSLLYVMASNQHRFFNYINSQIDWGWLRWSATSEFKFDGSKKTDIERYQLKFASNIGASIVKGLDVQMGAYYVDANWGVGTGLIWKLFDGLSILQKQQANSQLYNAQYSMNAHTQLAMTQQNTKESDGFLKSFNQFQLSQGNDEEQLQLGWEWIHLKPSTLDTPPSKTPNTVQHNVLYRNQRMEAQFIRNDYNENIPDLAILSWGTALVFADGEWGMSKPIDSGFMMLRVNSNVHLPTIYLNDRRVSDGLGAAVYQQLNPYQMNRLQLSAETNGEYLGGRQITIKPYPNDNYVVELDVSKRSDVTFQIRPYHRRTMMGQRITVERLDGAEEPDALRIGPDNRISIANVYVGKYRIRFGDTRLGDIILKVAPVVPDRIDFGMVELGSKQVVLYAN